MRQTRGASAYFVISLTLSAQRDSRFALSMGMLRALTRRARPATAWPGRESARECDKSASAGENRLDHLLHLERLGERREVMRLATGQMHDALELAFQRDGPSLDLREGVRRALP